jgi:hybrid cluster-associated redox disulfide protein
MKITKDLLIADILRQKPEAAEILMANGMGCIGCPASQMESLEQAAMVHGLDLEKLMNELNADA